MTMTAVDPAMQNYIREPQSIYDIQALVQPEWRKSDDSADHNTKEFEKGHVQLAKLDGDERESTKSPSTLVHTRALNHRHHEARPKSNSSSTSSPVSLLRQQLQEWEAHQRYLSAHENIASCANQHDHINMAAQTPSETNPRTNANLLSKSFEATPSGGGTGPLASNKKYTPLRHMASQPDLAARPVTQVTPYTAHADKSIGTSSLNPTTAPLPPPQLAPAPYVPIPSDTITNTTCSNAPDKDIHFKPSESTTPAFVNTPPGTSNIAIAANAQPHNLSRTQHKLLLQRQHVFASDKNYLAHPANMLRLTKEMDRVNREYHQVRKFEDPMTESLRRVAQRLADSKHEIALQHHAERLSRSSSASSLSSTSSSSIPDATSKGTKYLKKIYDKPWRSCQERVHQEYNKKDHVKNIINIK
jgi:TORC1 subunit TCO89